MFHYQVVVECRILSDDNSSFINLIITLWIQELKPTINTKDEYRSRTLSIKL